MIICEPRFTPGSILVTYQTTEDRFLVSDMLPAHFQGTCWSAENLAYDEFRKRIETKIGIELHEHQLATDIGSEFPYLAKDSAGWYTGTQLCHDAGLRQVRIHVQLKGCSVGDCAGGEGDRAAGAAKWVVWLDGGYCEYGGCCRWVWVCCDRDETLSWFVLQGASIMVGS